MTRREQAEAHRERARNLRAQGMTLAQIGREMGVSRQRAQQLLAPMKPLRVMPDDAVIVALYEEGLTDADVAREVGVSRMHIQRVRARSGVKGRRGHPPLLVACEVERLIEMAKQGATDDELSDTFGVSVRQINRLRCANGIKRHGRRPPSRHRADVLRLYGEGKLAIAIATALGIQCSRVYRILKQEGVPLNRPKTLPSKDDIEAVVTMLRAGVDHKTIAQTVGVSRYRVNQTAYRLRVSDLRKSTP